MDKTRKRHLRAALDVFTTEPILNQTPKDEESPTQIQLQLEPWFLFPESIRLLAGCFREYPKVGCCRKIA